MNDQINPLTRQQATKLAELVSLLRSEFDYPGALKFIGEAVQKEHGNAYQTCLAAIRAAWDLQNRGPAIIGLPGRHWTVEHDLKTAKNEIQELRKQLEAAQNRSAGIYAPPITNDPRCHDHPEEHFSSCRECAKEKVPMPSDFRKLAGIVPKQPRKRHRSDEEAETGQEPIGNETKPGEGHAA